MSTPKGDGSFNVYDDIRSKLLTAGVPEQEIEFIHNADTENKKAELFSKVRSGQVRVLLGSVIAGAMGLLVLILSDGQADALWACAMLIGAAACFLGVSRRGMLLCSLMGLLVAQGAAGVSGVLRADVQPWTDAALLCASVSTALAEIVRRTAIFLLTPPGVKGGHRG